jgi:hypothetical protein
MARAYEGEETPTAWTRMPSGKTLSSEIRSRGGVTGKARQTKERFNSRLKAGEVPFSLEDMVPEEDIQHLKHGNMQTGAVLLDQYENGKVVDPFPTTGTKDQLREVIGIHDNSTMGYYEPDIGETYSNRAATPVRPGTERWLGQPDGYTSAAPLSDVPTSTTDPERPRTVGAGYQIDQGADTGKLTVVFRDGVYYNYYSVSPSEWLSFKNNQSKGRFIKAFLDSKPRGVANASNIDPVIRQKLYRILETSQRFRKGKLAPARKRRQVTKAASPTSANPRPRRR